MLKLELFVPGRLCLLGEHSDWAGMYKSTNADIVAGEAIVTGVEQGIYATVEKADDFQVDSCLDIYHGLSFACEMDADKLRKTANDGGFFSYVAGVASYVCENYKVGGLHINITNMTLPIKSGLSSSAAICVLVARAFNILYKLKLNTMGEMQIAFIGEQRTPSRCGRLDQACAYGVNPVQMIFDGTEICVKPIKIIKPMFFVVADLCSKKDTIKILSDLNKCFPFAESEKERAVQEALGVDNHKFIIEAKKMIEQGDNEGFGKLMVEFQNNFDKKVAPVCMQELKAPVLHSVLEDMNLKRFVFGAKGVGSQGDGTVQLLAKDEESQKEVIRYLGEHFGMPAFPLTLRPKQAITKAIIPVAGFGTRLYPTTKVVKKDFMPILDIDGQLKPVLLIMIEELLEAGIEDICLVIGEEEKSIYDEFFGKLSQEHYNKISSEKKTLEDRIQQIGSHITYAYQKERKGFGHAVYQCREFTNDEPVILLLGDMIYHSFEANNCTKQMIDMYEKKGLSIISMHTVPKDDVVHYGILYGEWENKEQTLLKLDAIVEKPTCDYAADFLKVKTRASKENYYAVFGQYVLTKDVFTELENNIKNNIYERGEIQLTTALEQVRRKYGIDGFVVNGKSYDIGLPEEYYKTAHDYYAEGLRMI